MKVDYKLFINSNNDTYQKYVNFYNSFGYLRLTNALDNNLVKKCRKEYKRLYEEKNKKPWNKIMNSGGYTQYLQVANKNLKPKILNQMPKIAMQISTILGKAAN